MTETTTDTCSGPLIWFTVLDSDPGAILECATCDYIVVSSHPHDQRHADTPLLREGMAA